MPAKNADHDIVREAVVADGWTIRGGGARLPAEEA
jgi:hypothetical protein